MIKFDRFEHLVCSPETEIRDVLARIDRATPHLFQVVVDSDQRLMGTITDGDIRRALLKGLGVEAQARQAMNATPKVGHVGHDQDNTTQLATMVEHEAFLPVVDAAGQLREIIVAAKGGALQCAALVMAGGRGRRLGKTTQNTPKPLVKVGERPILDHILARLETAGVNQIYISVHYLADQFEAHLSARDNRANIALLPEQDGLGTAGAIANLPAELNRPTLVINGDVMTDTDFAALEAFHLRHGYDGSIGVARYDVEIPYGVVRQGEDGLFTGIDEKPLHSHFVAAGIYYLGREFRNLVPRDRYLDMPALLNQGREIGLRVGLFPIHEYWTDIGRPADLEAADAMAKQRG